MQLLCPACARLTEQRRLFAKNQCDILKCEACGLGRAIASNFKPEEYYTTDYFSGGRADGYADYRGAEPILRREFARTVRFIRKYRVAGRLLEIGCAYGFFLKEAQAFYDVSGIEIAQEAADFCRSRDLRVVTGVPEAMTLKQFGAVDIIVLLDVVEHLPDPQQVLAACSAHLNPDGIIVITTGDFASFFARIAGRHWRLMTPPQHLWYFTPKSLWRLGESLGLKLEAYDHPRKLVPLSLIAFQLRRMLRVGDTLPVRRSHIGIPINMFDAMRCVLRKRRA
jgi:SAM-dependent methyltransferase